MSKKISALSFVYNESRIIERSLKSIRPYVDEIVIVDCSSTDNTQDICKKYVDKLIVRPWLLCGDEYKLILTEHAKGDWLLWTYADEVWPKKTAEIMHKIVEMDKFNAYSFMRHEYMDGQRLLPHGTPQAPNYQNRLHKRCPEIFYTELVHAEIHGQEHTCPMPPEYFMEHHKTSVAQEFDNIRLYIWYKYLIWKYGDTKVEPFKTYVDSYRGIIATSEKRMAENDRRRLDVEEEWWRWREFQDELMPKEELIDEALTKQGQDKNE